MRVFSATLATETNTFAPMPTGLSSFQERGDYKAGQHPDHMSVFAGPLGAARLDRQQFRSSCSVYGVHDRRARDAHVDAAGARRLHLGGAGAGADPDSYSESTAI